MTKITIQHGEQTRFKPHKLADDEIGRIVDWPNAKYIGQLVKFNSHANTLFCLSSGDYWTNTSTMVGNLSVEKVKEIIVIL